MMNRQGVALPDAVRRRAAALGAVGQQWVTGLSSLVADLAREWDLILGSPLDGGTEAYVVEAHTADGSLAILKVHVPEQDSFARPGHDSFADEIKALLLADGRGYVRVLRHDVARRAQLQERLGRPLCALGLPIKVQIEIMCATLLRAWAPVPPDAGFQSGAEKARRLTEFISHTWIALNRPCSERSIAQALSFAETRARAFDPATAVLVHGDAHNANTLGSQREEPARAALFTFIDPDGLWAERAYDLGILMREWTDEFLAGDAVRAGQERCAYLSALTGVDRQAIWQWGVIERVSTGLHALQVGLTKVGLDMLRVADAWAMS